MSRRVPGSVVYSSPESEPSSPGTASVSSAPSDDGNPAKRRLAWERVDRAGRHPQGNHHHYSGDTPDNPAAPRQTTPHLLTQAQCKHTQKKQRLANDYETWLDTSTCMSTPDSYSPVVNVATMAKSHSGTAHAHNSCNMSLAYNSYVDSIYDLVTPSTSQQSTAMSDVANMTQICDYTRGPSHDSQYCRHPLQHEDQRHAEALPRFPQHDNVRDQRRNLVPGVAPMSGCANIGRPGVNNFKGSPDYKLTEFSTQGDRPIFPGVPGASSITHAGSVRQEQTVQHLSTTRNRSPVRQIIETARSGGNQVGGKHGGGHRVTSANEAAPVAAPKRSKGHDKASMYEKARTQKINTALDNLRQLIPINLYVEDRPLSKVKTIRLATSYIAALGRMVDCRLVQT